MSWLPFVLIAFFFQNQDDAQSVAVVNTNGSMIITNDYVLDKLNLKNGSLTKPQGNHEIILSRRGMAFFCKIENQLGKSSNFPVKMRLGDVRYTDAMEGKQLYNPAAFTKNQRTPN